MGNVTHNGEPDRFALCSGGMDSVAMTHHMMQQWDDERKRPVIVYLDTGIGLPSQRIYVEELCDDHGWQLWKLRTHENYEEHSREQGFYGPQQHGKIFSRLKGRQIDKLATVAGNPHFYFGTRRAESANRADIPEKSYKDQYDAWTHNPIADWSDADVVEYIAENDLPINPNWEGAHPTDCACGSTASREELIELEAEGYEVFAEKLRTLETEVKTGDRREVWAHGSLSRDEQEQLDAENNPEQTQLGDLMCGPNCSGKSKAADLLTDGGPSDDEDPQ